MLKNLFRFFICLLGFLPALALAQGVVPTIGQYVATNQSTAPWVNTSTTQDLVVQWVVPTTFSGHMLFVTGVAAGGAGGPGQAAANTAGGGGGGGGEAASGFPIYVNPGMVLTLTLGNAAPGIAPGATPVASDNTTITGDVYIAFPILYAGGPGQPGAAGVGGAGGSSHGATGGVHDANGPSVSAAGITPLIFNAGAGAGGISTSGAGGTLGGGSGPFGFAISGSGGGGGGSGGASYFGAGQNGVPIAGGPNCSATPLWNGFGGGGCGGAANGFSGPGGPSMIVFSGNW